MASKQGKVGLHAEDLKAVGLQAIDLKAEDLKAVDLQAIDLKAVDLKFNRRQWPSLSRTLLRNQWKRKIWLKIWLSSSPQPEREAAPRKRYSCILQCVSIYMNVCRKLVMKIRIQK